MTFPSGGVSGTVKFSRFPAIAKSSSSFKLNCVAATNTFPSFLVDVNGSVSLIDLTFRERFIKVLNNI